jgi:hypothetical protein
LSIGDCRLPIHGLPIAGCRLTLPIADYQECRLPIGLQCPASAHAPRVEPHSTIANEISNRQSGNPAIRQSGNPAIRQSGNHQSTIGNLQSSIFNLQSSICSL